MRCHHTTGSLQLFFIDQIGHLPIVKDGVDNRLAIYMPNTALFAESLMIFKTGQRRIFFMDFLHVKNHSKGSENIVDANVIRQQFIATGWSNLSFCKQRTLDAIVFTLLHLFAQF